MSVRDNKNTPGEVGDTGHVWDDDLRDLVNPPPKWWLFGLYASGLFVVGYILLYPSIPLLTTHTKGLMGWTSMKEYKEDKLKIDVLREPFEKRIHELSAKEILDTTNLPNKDQSELDKMDKKLADQYKIDKGLVNYISRSGKVLFGDNCSACHGSGGQGNPGFPVLADDEWLYEGTVEKIEESITLGRNGMMMAHASSLSAKEIDDLSKHVLALSTGGEYAPGKAVFMSSDCTACHGADAKGMSVMGSANLTDSVWRFSGTLEAINYTITHGVNDPTDPKTRAAQMPSFGSAGKLSADEIKKLAVYVHQLGGGK